MRTVPRYVMGAVVALGLCFLLSLVASAWLRSATPQADLLWDAAPTSKVAVWTQAASHGVAVDVTASAGIASDRAERIVDRIGGLLDRDVPTSVGFTFSVLLVPLTILGLAGASLAGGARLAEPRSWREAAGGIAAASVVYGIGLALLSAGGTAERGAGGRFLEAGVEVGVSPEAGLLLGLWWGLVFSSLGTLLAPAIREQLGIGGVLARGWVHGVGAGAAVTTVGLGVWGLTRTLSGEASVPDPALVGLGGLLLFPNAVATALVLAHGASMRLSLEAGPLAGWTRLDYLHTGLEGEPAAAAWWLFLAVPIVAGLAAGRQMRKRSTAPRTTANALRLGLAFGAAWGVTLAVLAMLTRVRVLSDFSIGLLTAGGGEAAIDPFAALILGTLWGSAAATAGTLTVRERASAPSADAIAEPAPPQTPSTAAMFGSSASEWTCPRCTRAAPATDRYCGACGAPRP